MSGAIPRVGETWSGPEGDVRITMVYGGMLPVTATVVVYCLYLPLGAPPVPWPLDEFLRLHSPKRST